MPAFNISPTLGEYINDFAKRLILYADATDHEHYGVFNGRRIRAFPEPRQSIAARAMLVIRAWEEDVGAMSPKPTVRRKARKRSGRKG